MAPERRNSEHLTAQLLLGLVVLALVFAILRMLFPVLLLAGLTAGGWWLWKNFNSKRLSTQQQLKLAFYELLEQHQGRITLIDFAYKTNMLGKEAKLYLDERAKEFNASFEVDDQGNMVYCFGTPNRPPRSLIDPQNTPDL